MSKLTSRWALAASSHPPLGSSPMLLAQPPSYGTLANVLCRREGHKAAALDEGAHGGSPEPAVPRPMPAWQGCPAPLHRQALMRCVTRHGARGARPRSAQRPVCSLTCRTICATTSTSHATTALTTRSRSRCCRCSVCTTRQAIFGRTSLVWHRSCLCWCFAFRLKRPQHARGQSSFS